MDAFYFGEQPKTLFGAYHAPYAARDRRHGIIMCMPLGQEYVRSHRSFRQLAVNLAAAGFHVLRFDYYGAGDSSGNYEDGNVQQWLDDIDTAIGELKDYGDIRTISAVGLRMGATLALLYGSQRKKLHRLVMWDPVINGRNYLSEVSEMHEDWLKDLLPQPPEDIVQNGGQEVLGFPLSTQMAGSIADIDILDVTAMPAEGVLIIESEDHENNTRLAQRFRQQGVSCNKETIPGSRVWRKGEALNSVLMSNETLQSITNWFQNK